MRPHYGERPLKTPLQFQELYNIPELLPTRKLWRAWLSYTGSHKKELISTMWALEHSGALAQIGDGGKVVDRVRQKEISAILGLSTRETLTKRLAMFYSFAEACARCRGENGEHAWPCLCVCHTTHPEWRPDTLCNCHQPPLPKRECSSQKMLAITAVHPHWNKSSSQGRADGALRLANAESKSLAAVHESVQGTEPGKGEDAGRARKHVAGILARNPGWRIANSYALACDDGKRPKIEESSRHVAFLAQVFGGHLFSREKQTWLDRPRSMTPEHQQRSLGGYRKSYGWIWDPRLPDAPDCSCTRGEKRFEFAQDCPECQGVGFVIGGSMTDYCRMQLHFLLDRGLDVELRRCHKCKRNFEGNQLCPGCKGRGDLFKRRGYLNENPEHGYTEEDIGQALGLHVSTVRKNFRVMKRLNIIRTAKGEAWRKCQNDRCRNLPLYSGKCPGCGSSSDAIKRRDPQIIIFCPSRTFDRQMARAERERLDATVRHHRQWLDKKHQAELEAAVDLAKKLLGEWEGKEHLLISFYKEMRRRLALSKIRSRLRNALFPLQRE